MKLLLDTHLLIWAAEGIDRVPPGARAPMADPENELFFSAASLWEIAIKRAGFGYTKPTSLSLHEGVISLLDNATAANRPVYFTFI